MTQQISIAEARDRLTRLIRRVENGESIELTRRGKPVAALVSTAEFRRLKKRGRSFSRAWRDFREGVTDRDLEALAEALEDLRDRTPGREVPA